MRCSTIDEMTYFDIKLRSYNQAQICKHTIYRQHGSTEYVTKHSARHYSEHYSVLYSERSSYTATCPRYNAAYNPEADSESKLLWRYHTSHQRLIVTRARIIAEGDDNAAFATTLNANNFHTGSVGMNHHQPYSPIEKTASGSCSWRRSNKCKPRIAKSAPRDVIAIATTNEWQSHMFMSQSQMRSQLSLDHPEIQSCYL